MTGGPPAGGVPSPAERRYPPIAQLAVAAMALALTGGIYLAAYLPGRPPFAPAVGLLIAAGVLLLANAVLLGRLRQFAWDTFFLVGRWTLLAYGVIAAMLEYVFVRNDARGTPLALMTLLLVVFAVAVPMVLAFSVARYQEAGRGAGHR